MMIYLAVLTEFRLVTEGKTDGRILQGHSAVVGS